VPSEELRAFVERGRSKVAHNRLTLQGIERRLAMREEEVPVQEHRYGCRHGDRGGNENDARTMMVVIRAVIRTFGCQMGANSCFVRCD
jgi:hypothetical protein